MNTTTAAIPVFYSPKQVAVTDSMSPSAGKPSAVVGSWLDLGLPVRIVESVPVTAEDFALAHDRSLVEGVLACRMENGFGNCSPEVAASLPWTTGSLVSAALHVLAHGGVAAAPCSGFHHARYAQPAAFCTFNGLMVTALKLKAEGRVARVGILDCDQHFGDGTEEIITKHCAADWITHITVIKDYPRNAEKFLANLPLLMGKLTGCDVLLYQAGADPHLDDPLGGYLDGDQLALRDAIVFAEAKRLGLPLAWNLAGGYQTPLRRVLNIHDRTMIECVRAYLGTQAFPEGLREGWQAPEAYSGFHSNEAPNRKL